jgi:uncharacterized pyridoxamine 5'-phosphate oxidase family protein
MMNKEIERVHDFLKKVGTYYLATADGNIPRVRPFGTVNYFDGKLYIQTGANKDVVKQITANPAVEISGYDGETWIRLSATLVADNDPAAQESMLEAYPFLRELYKYQPSMLYYLKDATASFCKMGPDAPETVKF